MDIVDSGARARAETRAAAWPGDRAPERRRGPFREDEQPRPSATQMLTRAGSTSWRARSALSSRGRPAARATCSARVDDRGPARDLDRVRARDRSRGDDRRGGHVPTSRARRHARRVRAVGPRALARPLLARAACDAAKGSGRVPARRAHDDPVARAPTRRARAASASRAPARAEAVGSAGSAAADRSG